MEEIRRELESLLQGRAKEGKKVGPRRVYRHAMANPDSAIYRWLEQQGCFADNVAERYGVLMAGRLLRTVKVTIEDLTAPPITVRVFTSLPEDRGKRQESYRSTKDVLAKDALRAQLVQSILGGLAGIRDRYGHLHELTSVWREIDRRRTENAA